MTNTLRLTAAQALVRWMEAQRIEVDGQYVPFFGGVWAIFGHGNVAGLGEALSRSRIPTMRAHNEQSMAHAATAYAKAHRRRRAMMCTTSIGPGATNLVTAAATAHVNRLPLLLVPGDVFASRVPDPVLQQLEVFADATISVNDCLRPVSRLFDRILRPEMLIAILPQVARVLTDPAECGPVTLAFPQDVQCEAFDYPTHLFDPQRLEVRRSGPDARELVGASALIKGASQPLVIAGGGVRYARAEAELASFASKHGVPVAETQAGKGALAHDHPMNVGGLGVTGAGSANRLAQDADLILAVGTRLQDFTTASRTLFANPKVKCVGLNVQAFDAVKHRAVPLVADATVGISQLSTALAGWQSTSSWLERVRAERIRWAAEVDQVIADDGRALPSDAQVIGAVMRARPQCTVVGAAGGLPGELHKLWRVAGGDYHLEYGYSCMGYEIAGGLGVKLAQPGADVVVLLGDGSYLMMNSELATAAALGIDLTVVLLDNGGFGCIHRLQRATGNGPFNNVLERGVDLVAHAQSLGAHAERARSLAELESALARTRAIHGPVVLLIATDRDASSGIGGAWWDVAVAEVSEQESVRIAHAKNQAERIRQRP